MRICILLLLLGSILVNCSSPQNLQVDSNSDSVAAFQAYYLKEAYTAGLFEIKASEIAINKATNLEIKEFAGALAGTNQRMNNEISQMAYNRKIKLPIELNQFHQVKLKNLESKLSQDFDLEYIIQMENNQRWTADFFEKVSKESEDNEITTWAIHSLPTIRDNLDRSRIIKRKLGQ